MNTEDIIAMAREAGFEDIFASDSEWLCFTNDIESFFQAAYAAGADAEREACAKVCEDIDTEYEGEDVLATWCAAAIRARGEQK
jgi:hypothetical protein